MTRPSPDDTQSGHRSERAIRRAAPADWPRLRAIEAASLSSPTPALLRMAVGPDAAATPTTRSASALRSGPLALVALVDDVRVGYALALAGEATETTTLVELAVAPAHRRQGHGSALLEAVIEGHDGHELRLMTRADDAGAREFYAAHGFRVRERLPEHYDGEPGVVLVRQPESGDRG